jgi:hypothetical protein
MESLALRFSGLLLLIMRRVYIGSDLQGPREKPSQRRNGGEAMKNTRWLMTVAFLVGLLMPATARAQSPFDGTWKVDLKTAKFPEKPDVYLLQDGMYHCKTCVPSLDVKADGQDHEVSGHPYYDMVSIKVADDRTIEETDKKNGKTVATSKTWVSADGNALMFEFTDSSATNADPVTGKGEETRVAKGPAGSHAISGSWRMSKMDTLSDNAISITYKVSGDSLSMSNLTGQSYTAKLDGTEAPYQGDPGTTSVSVKKVNKNTFEESDKRDGKVIAVAHITVSADGKALAVAVEDKLRGTSSHFTATKQ